MWLCGWQAFCLTLCTLPIFAFFPTILRRMCVAQLVIKVHTTRCHPQMISCYVEEGVLNAGAVLWLKAFCFFLSRNTAATALPSVAYKCLVASLRHTEKGILHTVAATACVVERLWSRCLPLSPVSSRQNKSIFMCVPAVNRKQVCLKSVRTCSDKVVESKGLG